MGLQAAEAVRTGDLQRLANDVGACGILQCEGAVGFQDERDSVLPGINQLRNTPKEWGQGAEGFGRRYGSAYAQRIIGQTIENGLAFGLHEDNRYFASGKQGIGRLGYAITSAFLARHDDGPRFISLSGIGGTAGASFISRVWQPRSTTSMGDGAMSFGAERGA